MVSINSDGTSLLPDSTETDNGRAQAKKNIDVKGLVKIYSETGETAVAGLTLNAVKGEVAVLLGHNGAGKSTTFSAISGIIAPTAGEIRICGYDVRTQRNEARKMIGLCPQHNSLYEKLTVKEHLWLVHGLKGADRSEYADEEKYLLQETKLDEKENEKAMNLSGGMKRKLCVCMALIGKSPVVLLDEPTADSSLLIWVEFYYSKFGSGYLLTAVLMEEESTLRVDNTSGSGEKEAKKMEANANELVSICIRYCKGAQRGEIHGKQIEIILPEKAQDRFPKLFEHLELIQEISLYGAHNVSNPNRLVVPDSLRIKSFGLSLNTLEQVFIRIGEMAETALLRQQSHPHITARSVSDSRPHAILPSSQLSHDSYVKLIESQGG
ncbi:hypothetical protein WR25_15452 [Diploscapter pachys]|uniref:ABC transporter domain-containing protein n=1 Tax=Diploscapter pachys TaxID=2018661 RepID=A0A2A2JCV4_9BILA|nr:hypothetical protein WR25_15452 [Diploscapter pachys]